MLPTFVIGLREGLEASLIVGIVAAFLRQQGRPDLLRWVFAGVSAALVLCFGAGVALEVLSKDLPQRQQEGLETVIGAVAVAMVTYMVVWMKRHSRDLKGQLEGAAGEAIAHGSGFALVAMAFLAVLREGLETAVFLLAAFNETGRAGSAATGAVLGILLAIVLGYGIYRGGVSLNLAKFFRATGVVLVFVAAGLVLTALHTAHEAGWLNAGQQSTVNLSSIVRNGSITASLLTGVLGLLPRPVLIEVVGWLLYLVPLVAYVGWPPGRSITRRTAARLALAGAVTSAVAAVLAFALVPSAPAHHPVTAAGGMSAQPVSVDGSTARVSTTMDGVQEDLTATRTAAGTYVASRDLSTVGRPTVLSYDALAALNGGRLPLGARGQDAGVGAIPVSYTGSLRTTFSISAGRVTDIVTRQSLVVLAKVAVGEIPLSLDTSTRLAPAAAQAASVAASADQDVLDQRQLRRSLAQIASAAAVLLAVAAGVLLRGGRPRGPGTPRVPTVARTPMLTETPGLG